MGKKARNTGKHGYHAALNNPTTIVNRRKSDGEVIVDPILCAISSAALSGAVAWVQAQSKDLLPRYVMAPGVIGACCAGITAILSVFAGIQLHKGNGYHDKVESNERRNHRDKEENEPQATLDALKHKSHPFSMWHWALLGAGVLLILTVGSYCYMLLCITAQEDKYCVAWATATSIDDCSAKGNGGTLVVVSLFVVTGLTGVFFFRLSKVVKDSLDYHDYRTARLQKNADAIEKIRQRQRRNGQASNQNDPYNGGRQQSYNEKDDYGVGYNEKQFSGSDDDGFGQTSDPYDQNDDYMDENRGRSGSMGFNRPNRNGSFPPSYDY